MQFIKIFYLPRINFFMLPYNKFMKTKVVFLCILSFAIVLGVGALIYSYDKVVYPLKYTEEINAASEEFGVSSELIASIINAESHFNERAVSNKGAVGLMQIMPSTAEFVIKKMVNENVQDKSDEDLQLNLFDYQKGEGELFDPLTNIRIGTCYISYLIKKFKNIDTALCAYNAGEGKVAEWLNKSEYSVDKISLKTIPYRETNNYVEKVNINLKVYSRKINNRWKKVLTRNFS